MASTISTAHEFKRQDTFRVDTRDVVVDRERIGRVASATPAEVRDMADSIAVFGQLAPVEVVKNSAGTMSLVSGFTRFDAVELLNANTTNLDRVLLWCVVRSNTTQNAEDSLCHNIAENVHRKGTTGLDDAENQKKLRDLGWDNPKIARLYRCTPGRVSQLSRLLGLIPAIRQMVIDKRLTCSAAEELGTLPEEEQLAWFEEFTSTGEVRAESADVKEMVSKAKQEAGESGRSMTLAAVRKWLASVVQSDDAPELFKDFCVSFQQFTSGEADESHVWHAVDAMLNVEPPKKRKAG